MQRLARLSLETVGKLELLVCSSGEEALEKGVAFAPDLILFDVVMPGMDGPATFAALRATAPLGSVPIVFLTAQSDPASGAGDRLVALGALGVISKPFDLKGLPALVRGIWETQP